MRSLRTQLLISHLALVLLVGIVLSGAVLSFVTLRRTIDQVVTDNYPTVARAQRLGESLRDLQLGLRTYAAGEAAAGQQASRDAYARAVLNTRALGEVTSEGEQRIVAQLTELLDVIGRELTFLDRPTLTVQPGVVMRLQTAVDPQLRRAIRRTDELRRINELAIFTDHERAKAQALSFSYIGIFVTLFSLVVAIFLAYRMMDMALRPLALIARAAESLGSGNLTERLVLPRDDEIGQLADSFNEMAARFSELQTVNARRLEKAQLMSDAALDSLYDPVIVTDAKHRIVQFNRAAESIFGPAPSDPRRHIREVINDSRIVAALTDEDLPAAAEQADDDHDERNFVPIRVRESEKTYRVRVTPMTTDEGKRLGSVAVLEDFTANRELDRLKTEFIGVAAHELRTPVTGLLLAVQLLEEGAAGDLTASQRDVVRVQRQDLERLEQLTRDLLDITKLESGTMTPRPAPVTIARIFEDVERTMAPIARAKGVRLTILPPDPPETMLRVDRGQIGRVLINLVNNAVRHTPPDGSVQVSVRIVPDQVSFQVEDTGEGVPAEYRERIFQRFVQVPGSTQGGAGLGLSIAQRIVENHGGEMTLLSELGKGSTFGFVLPARAIEPSDSASGASVS
ncbi:MAG: ATP-binding protein [Fimbriimonadaceae bacterium]|nr:ATP-binding protein [Fimbriimonadaceae bacterium]